MATGAPATSSVAAPQKQLPTCVMFRPFLRPVFPISTALRGFDSSRHGMYRWSFFARAVDLLR
jgi:hypothetical protein